MNELSNFGDAVQSQVTHENEYQLIWKKTMENIDFASTKDMRQTFLKLEEILKKFYQNILEMKTELPVSLKEIVSKQPEKL